MGCIGLEGPVVGGVGLPQAVVRVVGIDVFAEHPAELARRRSNLVPGRLAGNITRFLGLKHFNHLPLVQPNLDDVADVTEAASYSGGNPVVGHHGQIVDTRLEIPAGDPGEAPLWGLDCIPSARVMPIDFDLLAGLELIGGIITLSRPGADIDVFGRNVGLVWKGTLPSGRGCNQDRAGRSDGKQQAHEDASRPKRVRCGTGEKRTER